LTLIVVSRPIAARNENGAPRALTSGLLFVETLPAGQRQVLNITQAISESFLNFAITAVSLGHGRKSPPAYYRLDGRPPRNRTVLHGRCRSAAARHGAGLRGGAIGQFYDDFTQVSDAEVTALLAQPPVKPASAAP